ncbi:MAG TPA: hypothetical protein VHT97_13495 [Acidimicrobiales bacterium]|jgi:hypothetical protein|nr:hypothetical protein [Acidimicrobiales bacterium]
MRPRQDDPAEQLLDVLVYAPLGLLLEARDLLPKLAEKGRQRMGGQVTVARMVGEMAVRQGQRRAEKVLDRLRQQNSTGAGSAAGGPGRSWGAGPTPGNGHGPTATSTPASAASPNLASASGPAAPAAPSSSSLAIPGYDTLSASQVVPRLEGLSTEELEAVRRYEEATRARKTVLTRIDQLRSRS